MSINYFHKNGQFFTHAHNPLIVDSGHPNFSLIYRLPLLSLFQGAFYSLVILLQIFVTHVKSITLF